MFTTRGTNFDKLVDKIFHDANTPLWKTTVFSTEDFDNAKVQNGIIYLALPGYSKDDVSIDIQGRILIVSADIQEDDENPFRKSFKRKWHLADDANVDEVNATMNDGLLSISFGKASENKKVKIS